MKTREMLDEIEKSLRRSRETIRRVIAARDAADSGVHGHDIESAVSYVCDRLYREEVHRRHIWGVLARAVKEAPE